MLEERALPEFKAALLLRPKTDKMGCSGPCVEPFRRERQRRVIRQISGEDRKLLLAVEHARAKPLAFDRHANDAGKAVIAVFRLRLARDAHTGERKSLHFGAREGRPLHAFLGDQLQDRLEPVVIGMVEMIGLRGRENDAIDAAPVNSECHAFCPWR